MAALPHRDTSGSEMSRHATPARPEERVLPGSAGDGVSRVISFSSRARRAER